MKWYYSKQGAQVGPIDQEELVAKISSGEIYQSDMVWREGMADWLPVSKVPELAIAPRAAQSVTPTANSPYPGNVMDAPYTPPSTSPQSYRPYMGPVIPTYLWQSIVITIFCCWPFGIPAIVYAAKVDGLVGRGDVLGAMSASKSAKNWCIAAVLGWVVVIVLASLFTMLGAVTSHR